jgi:hypothetical protein
VYNAGLNNAVFKIARRTKTGDDYGTPIFSEAMVLVDGWFDEPLSGMRAARADRGTSIPTTERRAVFFCAVGADLLHRDEGEIVVGGISQGRWTVEKDETVPIPGGVSHREVALQQVVETR